MQHLDFETVLLRGVFFFTGNPESNFKGPIKQGFRPIVWLETVHKSTSCSFISDIEISLGENKEIDLVLLNQLQLGHKIEKGTVLNVGSISRKIGEFKVAEHLGVWRGGKLP